MEPRDAVFWPRLFRLFRLSPTFPLPGLGPWKHVASVHMRVQNGPACQIFYPTEASSHDAPTRGNYMRERAVVGLANYAKVSPIVMSGLVNAPHHVLAAENSELHPDLAKTLAAEGKPSLPVIIFSHGLAGSSEVYSLVCKDLASLGNVVVAVEHEDQSGSYARTEEGKDLFYAYNPPPDFDYNKKEDVVDFRAPFLEHRVAEVKAVAAWLTSEAADAQARGDDDVGSIAISEEEEREPEPSSAEDTDVDRVWKQIAPHLDISSLVLAGHSFGAATMYLASKEIPSKCTVLLDTWSYPLSLDALSEGSKVPVLSVLSEMFVDNEFSANTQQLLSASKSHESYYIGGSVHTSFSDIPWFLPNWLARWAKLSGESDREVVRQANHELCAAFLAKHLTHAAATAADDVKSLKVDDPVQSRSGVAWSELIKPF